MTVFAGRRRKGCFWSEGLFNIHSRKTFWITLFIYKGLNVCVHPDSNAKILIPSVMLFGGGNFGRWWSHEGGALINDISNLIKRISENSLYPPSTEVIRSRQSSTWKSLQQNPTMLAPWSWTSSLQNYEELVSVVYKPPSLCGTSL